jgi:fructokinase
MKASLPLFAGVELGGTKCVCLIGTGPHDIRDQISVPTGIDSTATLARIEEILREWNAKHGAPAAVGIASFGPIDRSRGSTRYGFITSTPKPGWRNTDVAGRLGKQFPASVPVRFDTDVNGAALAEGRWGRAVGLTDFAYVTVGTGVGVGLVAGGRLVYGLTHPELGHIRIARKAGDAWPGSCVFHGDCVEGLASGVAIASRAGVAAHEVPAHSEVWDSVSHALAQLLHTIILCTAPQRILIGGGVMQARPELLSRIRLQLVESLNGYLESATLSSEIDEYVGSPGLNSLAGPLGALALAADAPCVQCD